MIKYILTLFLAVLSLQAGTLSTNLTAGGVNNVGGTQTWVISRVSWLSANASVITLYDTGAATTNFTSAPYTTRTSFQTNWVTKYTNSVGIIQTNTYRGTYVADVPVAGGTAEATKLLSVSVPANTKFDQDVSLITIKGLTVFSSQAGTLELSYRNAP